MKKSVFLYIAIALLLTGCQAVGRGEFAVPSPSISPDTEAHILSDSANPFYMASSEYEIDEATGRFTLARPLFESDGIWVIMDGHIDEIGDYWGETVTLYQEDAELAAFPLYDVFGLFNLSGDSALDMVIEDINYDGNANLRIICRQTEYGAYYSHWLWQEGTLVRNTELDMLDLPNPVFYEGKRVVSSYIDEYSRTYIQELHLNQLGGYIKERNLDYTMLKDILTVEWEALQKETSAGNSFESVSKYYVFPYCDRFLLVRILPTQGAVLNLAIVVEGNYMAESEFYPDGIRVYEIPGFEQIQPRLDLMDISINLGQRLDAEFWGYPESDLIIEDVNFDGILDFYIHETSGTYLSFYHYWVWIKDDGAFIYDEALNALSLPCPEFDAKEKKIVTYDKDGPTWYANCTYKYVRGKPTLME